MRNIAATPELDQLLAAHAPVIIGVSGGKDSTVAALETSAELDRRGHAGPRALIHAHLGAVEWKESLPTCQRLADRLGVELVVVEHARFDMLGRWGYRWECNVRRYAALECVQLILPWSTPSMRFCTAEMKTAPISAYAVSRWPGQQIVNVAGIRREESANRQHAPIFAPDDYFTRKKTRTSGFVWHPIAEWTLANVWESHDRHGWPRHEAYTRYGASRVSCCFCILGSQGDLAASAAVPEHAPVYRRMVDLEIESTFSFQSTRWLGDVAPQLLSDAQRAGLAAAKIAARQRAAAEARIPAHLRYTRGWPTAIPSWSEAQLLADVRREVAEAANLVIEYQTAESIIARYEQLISRKPAAAAPAAPSLVQASFAW